MLPLAKKTKGNNAAAIPRTFAFIQSSEIRSQGREIPRTIACSESIRHGMQRQGFGQTARAYRSYARGIRCYDEDVIGSSAIHDLNFLWTVNPENSPGRRGLNRIEDSGREVLPNVLPLPRKSSPKQDEPRAIRMGYVVEIEGTT